MKKGLLGILGVVLFIVGIVFLVFSLSGNLTGFTILGEITKGVASSITGFAFILGGILLFMINSKKKNADLEKHEKTVKASG